MSFHQKCEGKAKTLTVIKEKENSFIFGGYAETAWKITGDYSIDAQAFIFSLVNHELNPLKTNVTNSNEAFWAGNEWGPCFGDYIYIHSDSNANRESNSNFGNFYQHPNYPFNSNKAKKFLAGTCNFSTSEIEVYEIALKKKNHNY